MSFAKMKTGWYPSIKRVIDFLVAAIALIILAIPMLLIAIAVRIFLGKPVFFRQRRPGMNEVSFTCVKFRSMTDARDSDGALLPDDQRHIWLGDFLRRTSLDELPQLWNVLRGDLSLIGPRPLLERYLPYYTETEQRRHWVRPGLTGWSQIHGRSCLPFDARLAMDVWYVDHMSWRLDLQIFLATIWIVLTQHGTPSDGLSPMAPLDEQRSKSMAAAIESSQVEH
jgi:lipopolysaccharide/colanic/teichoic acid biosynthesis glycosyltransferase